jgi:hypothetical protein
MSSSDNSILRAEPAPLPPLRPDPTIEELDEWVRAIGGRELTPEESAKLRAEVRWHQVPSEPQDDCT